jgi:hypothetical protein
MRNENPSPTLNLNLNLNLLVSASNLLPSAYSPFSLYPLAIASTFLPVFPTPSGLMKSETV